MRVDTESPAGDRTAGRRGRSRRAVFGAVAVLAIWVAGIGGCSASAKPSQSRPSAKSGPLMAPACAGPRVWVTTRGVPSGPVNLRGVVGKPMTLSVTITDRYGSHMSGGALVVARPGSWLGSGSTDQTTWFAHSDLVPSASPTAIVELTFTPSAAGEYKIAFIGTYTSTIHCGVGAPTAPGFGDTTSTIGTLTVP